MSEAPVVVVGATGNVGRGLVALLTARELPLRAVTRDLGRARRLLGPDVPLAVAALDDHAALEAALDGAGALFLACGNGPTQEELETSVVGAARRRGVERVVKLSSVVAALDETSQHRRVELTVERSGASFTHLRPAMYVQSLLTLAERRLCEEGALCLPLAAASVNAVDVRDIAQAACAVLTEDGHDGIAYALIGRAETMSDAAEQISSALGEEIRYVDLDPEQALADWTRAGLDPSLGVTLSSVFHALRTMPPLGLGDDLPQLLGRAPRTWAEAAALLTATTPPGEWRDLNLVAG